MNGTKKIARAMLYCSPVIPRLGRRPSILAFPGIVSRKLAVSDADGHTNIGFIDVCNQIQKHQHWDQAPLIKVILRRTDGIQGNFGHTSIFQRC